MLHRVCFDYMIKTHTKTMLALTALALLAVLAVLAWTTIAPALDDGWLSGGMAFRVFLPLLIVAGSIVWIWRR